MKKFLLLTICFALLSFCQLSAQIYSYDNDVSGIPTSVDPLIATYSNLTAIGTGITTPCTYGFSGITGFVALAYGSSNPCIEVSLTALPGFSINATGFSAGLRRSGTGPTVARFAYSTDGGTTWIDDGVDHPTGAGGCSTPTSTTTIVSSFPSLCVTATSIIFRIYPFNGASGGAIQVYGLTISGSVVPTASLITPVIFPSDTAHYCPGFDVALNTIFDPSYTYQWRRNGVDLAGETNDFYFASTPGNYSVRITGTGSCVDTAVGVLVTPWALPDTTMTITGSLTFCSPGTVTLSVPLDADNFYQWTETGTGTLVDFTESYSTSASGTYEVYIFNSTTGCDITSNAYTVNAVTTPVPTVTASGATTICSPATVTLSTPVVAGYTYQWYDAGGAISGATNASYLVSSSGVYYVVITNGTCSATSANTTVTVNAPPATPSVTPVGPVTVCAGTSVTLTSSTVSGVTYRWWRSPSAIPGATATTYGVPLSGTYSMVVTSTTTGCTATSNGVVVTINTLPNSTITANPGTTICSGSTVTLSTPFNAAYTYQWLSSNLPIGGATANTYATITAGTYRVIVTNGTTGCFDTTNAPGTTLTVQAAPTAAMATISPVGPFTICSNDSVVLTVPNTPGLTYQWFRGATLIPGATNYSYAVRTVGTNTYTIRVTNAAGCSTISATGVIVTVNAAPGSAVTTSGPTTFCTGGSVNLTGVFGAGYTYQWYDASGPIAGETARTYTASTSGTYYVVATSTAGCSTTSVSTTVSVIATPFIIVTGSPSFCAGNNILLSISTSGIPGVTYQWKRDGINIPGAVSANYVANVAGDYTCFVVIGTSCSVLTSATTITVFATLFPSITFDGTYFSTYNTYSTYQWYINTVTIPGATSYRVAPHTNGSYRVMVTDTNGCQLLSAEYPVFNVGVDDVNLQNAVSIYPNPATSTVHVAAATEVMVTITTLEGKKVIEGTSKNDLNISGLANGLYMISVYDNKGNRLHVEKLVKN